MTITPVVRPPPVPTDGDGPGRVEGADAAEQRCGRRGVADRGVDRGRGDRGGAERLGDARTEPAVGVGERPGAHVERGEVLADLAHDRQEHLFAEEPRVVEVAGRGLAVAPVAVEQRLRCV